MTHTKHEPNQASEDAKTARQILIEYSNQFINPMLTEPEPELDLVEALEGIEAIIRNENLKLLAEIREQQIPVIALKAKKPHDEVQIQAVPIESLAKLEAEL